MKTDFKKLSDIDLEAAWQAQCTIIQTALMFYYNTSDEKLRVKAEKAQSTQSEIQKEITRRSHND